MQLIELNPVPSQTLQLVLAGQNCQIAVYSKDGYDLTDLTLNTPNTNLYFDLTVNGQPITNTALCLNQKRLLINRQYLGVVGDFVFVDTQGSLDPQFTGLGSRWVLLYVEATDLAVALAANVAAQGTA